MNYFNNKIIRATQQFALTLLASFVLVSCGGGGGGGTTSQGTSIQAGAILTKPLMDVAMVGQPYANSVALVPIDPLNKVIGLTITNPTAGGSQPAIDNAGNVTWTPNDIDFANTKSLHITVMMEQGADVLLDIPVDVRNERVVYEVVLNPIEGSYTDSNGRYLVQSKKIDPGQAIAGSLKITEIFSGDGSFKPQYYLYNRSNVDLVIVEEPVSILPAQPTTSAAPVAPLQAAVTKAAPATYPLTSLIGLNGIPSVEGSKISDGLNVYSSRTKFRYAKETANAYVLVSSDYTLPFDFLGSCYDLATCQVATGTPVILIHGFTPEGANSYTSLIPANAGGKGTWGILPDMLIAYGHAVFEMRWMTQMRFEEAAGKLLEFSQAVATLTGKKPMIVAHSFGGIVAHLALQNKGNDWSFEESAGKWKSTGIDPQTVVSQLITLDSPLSGISDTIQPGFTVGRHFADITINTCGSVTCVQAGSFDQGLDALTLNVSRIDPEAYALGAHHALAYGESIKRIQSGVTTIPFFTVAGTNQKPLDGLNMDPASVYMLGDGLISLMGQAVDPNDFAIYPYISNKEYNVRFLSNKAQLDAYDNLPVGQCLSHTYNGHNYWICPRAAHTASTILGFPIHRTFRDDYSISYYEIPIEGGGSHPLWSLVVNPQTSIVIPPASYIDTGTPPPASIVRGRTIQYVAGTMSAVSLPITITFTDKSSGASSSSYLSSSNATGYFDIDIGKQLVEIYGSTASLANYTVKLKMGDGLNTRIYSQTITTMQALHELGNIDLTTDTTPPTVSSTSPASSSTGVAVNAAITATFSEPTLASTISSATFTLNNGASGTVTYSGTTASFTPSSNLAYSTSYIATITTGVKDASGNALANNYTWTFTTSAPPSAAPTVTLTPSPTSIANGATSTLSWSSTNSTSCASTGGGGTGTAGSFTTPALTATTTYTVTCTGAGGTASQSATVTVAGTLPASTLNDTGITSAQCYQAGSDILVSCGSAGALALNPAQDGMAGRDANAATNSNTDGKLGFSFTSVPASGIDPGSCVQANVTGLMWEVKTTDGGLRDWSKTYTNYDSTASAQFWNGSTFVNPTQVDIDAATNSIGFKNSVNAQGLCGYNDWRLPTTDELHSIVDYGVASPSPTIDTTWFPNTQGNVFWSASPYVLYNPVSAWHVNFSGGSAFENVRYFTNYVRLVRAGQAQTSPRYTVSTNGQEVTDNQTKLIWRRCAEGMNWDGSTCAGVASAFTHEAALQQATTQATSTGISWRLPNVKELSSIADKTLSQPAIDPTVFPATPVSVFWTASPGVGYTGYAWFVNFIDGFVSIKLRSYTYYVRLVRDAP